MKILHLVEFYKPSVGGAQECVKQISERLAKSGHSVTVFTSRIKGASKTETLNGVKIERFDVGGNLVRGLSGSDAIKFQQAIVGGSFDIVMCYAAQQWTFDLLNQIIDKVEARKVLVPCGFSGLANPDYDQYFQQMPVWLKKYDKLVLLSEVYQDALYIKKLSITNTLLIPNCADEREFAELPAQNTQQKLRQNYRLQDKVICTIGGYTGMKGQLESMAVFKRLPIRNTSLVVIGNVGSENSYFRACQSFAEEINSSQQRYNKNVVLLETGKDVNRTDTVGLLCTSNIFLLLSYIEASPLVLFEAMASSTPFISTRVGNVDEIISWTHAGLRVGGTVDRAGMYHVRKISALLKIWLLLVLPDYARHLGGRGRHCFKVTYNWEKCSKMYEEMYQNLLS